MAVVALVGADPGQGRGLAGGQIGQEIALEAAQRPRRRRLVRKTGEAQRIGREGVGMRIVAATQAQHELVDVDRREQDVAGQRQRGTGHLGAGQRSQFAARDPAKQQRLEWLQHAAREAATLAAHAARDQADAAMVAREGLDQQRRLSIRARVKDVGRLLVDGHGAAETDGRRTVAAPSR